MDAGDAHGEAKASLLLAHAFYRGQAFEQVAAELFRVSELEQLIGQKMNDWEDLAVLPVIF